MRAVLAVLVVATIAAPAMAQQDDRLRGVTLDLSWALRVEDAVLYQGTDLQDGAVAPGGCGGGRIDADAAAQALRFQENMTETGCGEGRFGIAVPPGAAMMRVDFTADRRVAQPPGPPHPLDMVQRMVVYNTALEPLLVVPYADSRASSLDARAYSQGFTLADQDNLVLGWYFEDAGGSVVQGIPSIGGAQAFAANITAASVAFPAVPWAHEGLVVIGTEDDGEQRRTTWGVDITLNATAWALTDRLVLSAAPSLVFLDVVGPDGTAFAATTTSSPGELAVAVTRDALEAGGPGTYRVRFTSVDAVPPGPLPSGPQRWVPMALGAALLPGAVGAIAATGAVGYSREAGRLRAGRHGDAWTPVAGVGLLYAAVLIQFFVLVGLTRMAELPPRPLAWIVFVQLLAVAMLFAVVATAGGRRLTQRLRSDITERQRREDDLRRSNRDLEMFAHAASHDLQEPLRKVAQSTQLLQERYSGQLGRDAEGLMKASVKGAKRMQTLIQDLLDLSTVGGRPLRAAPVALGPLVRRVIKDVGKGADFAVDALPTVQAEAPLLEQLFTNLLANAVTFRSERRPRVRISARRVPDGWEISVADDGIGIAPADHERIFEPFARLHVDYPGSGIGLTTCRRIVEHHGGRIWVESALGEGATFRFTLPGSATAGRVIRGSGR